jgi:hypothetical protein
MAFVQATFVRFTFFAICFSVGLGFCLLLVQR